MKARSISNHHRKTHQKNDESQKKISNGSVKVKWTSSEDEKLMKAVEKYHHKNWKLISSEVSTRSPKQCLERWYGMLDPSLIKTEFTPEEDQVIIDMQNRLGNKWTLIAECLPGRSAISVRNRSDLLKRHAKNPNLSKNHQKDSFFDGNSTFFQLNAAQNFNNNYQINQSSVSSVDQKNNSIQCVDKEKVEPQNETMIFSQEDEIQKYFSGNSWSELDRFFSNIDAFMFWNQNELFS